MRPGALGRTAGPLLAVWIGLAASGCGKSASPSGLGAPEPVAAGVELYRTTDESLIGGGGAVALYLLRVDPARATVHSVLSNGEVLETETVDAMARRAQAVAAINGGYFNGDNGEPIGLLKIDGELVSDTPSPKGAVIVEHGASGAPVLTFDRVSVRMSVRFVADGQERVVPIDGVDTTRERGRLMLYTPSYHADTDTAPTGTEWVVDGTPPRVVAVRSGAGHTPIPRQGSVLSYGGVELPEELAALVAGTAVSYETRWRTAGGLAPERLDRAHDIIGGAGLLRSGGENVDDWDAEGLAADVFVNVRHPRTFIGRDARGMIWLGVVDGRQSDHSVGMTFAELERLCDRLHLTDALNLDGGGSSTMVVRDEVVNRPSGLTGARAVSDAIVVVPR
jgi:hypothetical protein